MPRDKRESSSHYYLAHGASLMPTYEQTGGQTWKITDDGERMLLANFAASIVTEIRVMDGIHTETTLIMGGKRGC